MKTTSAFSLVFSAALAALCLAGCAPTWPGGGATGGLSPVDLVAQWARTHPGPASLKTMARIEVVAPTGRHPFQAALLVGHPDRLRMEILPPLGPPILFLSLREDDLRVYLPAEGIFYTGRGAVPYPAVLSGVGVPAADLVHLLAGLPPPLRATALCLDVEEEEDARKVRIRDAAGEKQILWFDRAGHRLRQVRVFPERPDTAPYTARFLDVREHDGGAVPGGVTITSAGIRMEVRYGDVELNARIPEDAFSLSPPAGIPTTPLDRPRL